MGRESVSVAVMRPITVLAGAALIALGVAFPAGAAARRTPARAAATCHKLAPTHRLRTTLRRVHRRALPAGTHARGPVDRVFYGRCGRRLYAFASFRHRVNGVNFGTQDQPERFRRRTHHRWRDRGDTGGDLCGLAPPVLLRAWGFRCLHS
jgi:hypothetical protein